jgi:hypothetical protein
VLGVGGVLALAPVLLAATGGVAPAVRVTSTRIMMTLPKVMSCFLIKVFLLAWLSLPQGRVELR